MGESFGYTGNYLLRNGKPWFPVMGEFHFNRNKPEQWEQKIRAMKASGINVINSSCQFHDNKKDSSGEVTPIVFGIIFMELQNLNYLDTFFKESSDFCVMFTTNQEKANIDVLKK